MSQKVMMVASATAITALVAALAQAIVAVFAYMLAVHNSKHDKKKERKEKIDAAERKVKEACHSGDVSDLLDATEELGDAKRGK